MTLISQRRMGKTGLILRLFDEIATVHPVIRTIYVDIFSSRCIDDFIKLLAEATMRAFQPKTTMGEKLIAFIKTMRPQLSFDSITGEPQLMIAYQSPHEKEYTLRGLLEFLDSQDVQIIIAIDEFQQIVNYADTLNFQTELRSIWQHHERVSYCLFGSRKHMMEALFDDTSKPFYKFGDIIYLQRIPTEYWVKYIMGKFGQENKTITRKQAEWIVRQVDGNSSYVQQLSWYVFQRTGKQVDEASLYEAFTELVEQCADVFEAKTESLTAYQMNFLRAVADGIDSGLSSGKIIQRYNLGSSANVAIIKKTLLEKDLIMMENKKTILSDPIMGAWLRNG
jgi:hypothetical protein